MLKQSNRGLSHLPESLEMGCTFRFDKVGDCIRPYQDFIHDNIGAARPQKKANSGAATPRNAISIENQ